MSDALQLLALSGSLRQGSHNTDALLALTRLAPASVQIELGSIADLPLFNPDLEGEPLGAVMRLKSAVAQADGIILASPEYAHGISGPMKNALDWLVSGEEFPNKPTMLINTSPRAHHAQDALKEVLITMSARIVDAAFVSIPLLGSKLDVDGILSDPYLVKALQDGLRQFCQGICSDQAP
ncbi:NADPH-dependent FMN reductase [Bowmanella denitrificans]|uniref:NADPH-dependent FMN reductase n=1 Tax=Bowmanella denitrificans TaxID=366582 RepID=UPI000C9BE560|nr:NADPH-dependent FMN reductase [Bowmanella denitrificans]